MAAKATVEFVGVDAGLKAEVAKIEQTLNSMGPSGGGGFAGAAMAGAAGGAAFAAATAALSAFTQGLSDAVNRNAEVSAALATTGQAFSSALDKIVTDAAPALVSALESMASIVQLTSAALVSFRNSLKPPDSVQDAAADLHDPTNRRGILKFLLGNTAAGPSAAGLARGADIAGRMGVAATEASATEAYLRRARPMQGPQLPTNAEQAQMLADAARPEFGPHVPEGFFANQRRQEAFGQFGPNLPTEAEERGMAADRAAKRRQEAFGQFGPMTQREALESGQTPVSGFDAQIMGGQELFKKIQQGSASSTDEEALQAALDQLTVLEEIRDQGNGANFG